MFNYELLIVQKITKMVIQLKVHLYSKLTFYINISHQLRIYIVLKRVHHAAIMFNYELLIVQKITKMVIQLKVHSYSKVTFYINISHQLRIYIVCYSSKSMNNYHLMNSL